MSSEFVTFVAARLDEREAEAHELHDGLRCASIDRDGGFEPERCDCGEPDRVRREVAAKRAILARWAKSADDPRDIRWVAHEDLRGNLALLWAVRQFAEVWSDHPDYQPEWKS